MVFVLVITGDSCLIALAQRHFLKINGSQMLLLLTEYWQNITRSQKRTYQM